MMRFSEDTFSEDHICTIGIDFKVRNVRVSEKAIRLQIWDTAG
jgi:Ras-related protein Rab-1A